VSEHVWYFAYGSNMQPATFEGRRGIAPLRVVVARLCGWRLVLDKPPLLSVGGAMANVVEDAAASVLGVAYALTPADFAHVELTEGVLIGNYRRAAVHLTPLAGPSRTIAGFTLTSDRRDPTLRPSRRYLRLLVEGAEERGLPAEYVAWLRTLPAVDEPPEAAATRLLIDRVLKKKEPR
jgi:gliotoxin/aspirochlorine biosynthesis gamma-glutamylcyclotransferase